ncbi:hypothetical protein [Novipirellula sp.]|uniref:hypothetical protein n=1 Tax=Novipirellula sp. TaxID=2795430 RepID=UPI00356AB495
MAIFEMTQHEFVELTPTSFNAAKIREREDLQRLLRSNIGIVDEDLLVIAEEFSEWDDSRRRIDLLAIDRDANLVVIELKRTDDGGHMDLQAIRYAAMVSTMTFKRAIDVYEKYLRNNGSEVDAEQSLLEFLSWGEADEETFGSDVRIVLIAADFSKEVTTAILWLNDRELDIRCIRLKPYADGNRIFVDVQQVIPLPEAAEYQTRLREKNQVERQTKTRKRDLTKFDVRLSGELFPKQAKRNAMLLVVRHLCDKEVTPEKIEEVLHWRTGKLFYSVESVGSSAEFIARASSVSKQKGRSFDASCFFCGDDELIHWNGRSFALSNQWGRRTGEALELLAKAFPTAGVKVEVGDKGPDCDSQGAG